MPFLLRCCTAAQESLRPQGTALRTFTVMGDMEMDTDMLTGTETGHTNMLTTLFCTSTAAPPPPKRVRLFIYMDTSIASKLLQNIFVVSLASEQSKKFRGKREQAQEVTRGQQTDEVITEYVTDR